MSRKKIRVSALPEATTLKGLYTIGVDKDNRSVKAGLEFVEAAADNANEAAESARKTEAEIKKAESARVIAESTRESNESTRKSAESARASAETVRISNETARKSAESARVTAETARASAESARKTAETNRESAESTRISNENARKSAETVRVNAESTRVSNETARKSAETARANAESTRITNETARVNAEKIRIANEEARVKESSEVITATNKAKDEAIQATKEAKSATEKAIQESENLAGLKADVIAATKEANAKAILANTAATNANTAASNANEKAGLANTAAANANDKAGLANTAASNANVATTNANTATGKANEAATAANNAAKSANNAAAAANTAAGSVNEAKTNAEKAAAAANTAAGLANVATDKANTATTNANTAATNANTKAGLANTAATAANTAATNANDKAGLANTAATTANSAAAGAKEISENPPKVSDTGTWLLYNLAQHKYVDSGLSARAHSPYIQNGTWWVYNDESNAYYNTGIPVSSTYELTKAKIEAVLTGPINSHTHSYAGSASAGGAANNSILLRANDIRSTDPAPGELEEYAVKAWFNQTGTPSSNWWSGISVKGWTGAYESWQICSGAHNANQNTGLYYRTGLTTWNAWRRIIDSGNYTSYCVPITRKINGKALSGDITLSAADLGAATTSHTHTKAQITDFPSSMPASDVYAWAKAATKPTYTASEVGAAAASHTHTFASLGSKPTTLDGYGVTDAAYRKSRVVDDYNAASYRSSGMYGVMSGATNGPGSAYLSLIVAANVDVGLQIAGGYNSNRLYYRGWASSGATYYNWSTVATTSDLANYAPLTGAGASGTWGINVTGNAASATKLATARTINGTNFDGSAAIVTAYWGTTRTITIGAAGKSVNGSANVSWSLAEIGAAAASHTHLYAGSSSAGGAASNSEKLGGLAVNTSGVNNVANQVARTNGNGYLMTGYINTNVSIENPAIGCFFVQNSSNDGYLRKITLAQVKTQLGSFPASDVYAWAKAATKPTYTAAEVGAAAASHTHLYAGSSTAGGSATTALKWATARTLSLTGDVTGSASIDGSGNVNLTTSLAGGGGLTDVTGWTGTLYLSVGTIENFFLTEDKAKDYLYIVCYSDYSSDTTFGMAPLICYGNNTSEAISLSDNGISVQASYSPYKNAIRVVNNSTRGIYIQRIFKVKL